MACGQASSPLKTRSQKSTCSGCLFTTHALVVYWRRYWQPSLRSTLVGLGGIEYPRNRIGFKNGYRHPPPPTHTHTFGDAGGCGREAARAREVWYDPFLHLSRGHGKPFQIIGLIRPTCWADPMTRSIRYVFDGVWPVQVGPLLHSPALLTPAHGDVRHLPSLLTITSNFVSLLTVSSAHTKTKKRNL